MSEFTLSNGMKLYYEDTGKGSPVVLMHGWSASHKVYEKPVQLLQDSARCIIYDHRGHGLSKKANREKATMETLASDLQELLQGLSLTDVTLVGWSMGACTAMTYLRDYGSAAIRQVVLCDMPPRLINDAEWHMGLYQGAYTADDLKEDAKKSSFEQYRKFILETVPKLKKLPRLLQWILLKRFLRACDEPMLLCLSDSMKQIDHRETVPKIDIPLSYFYADPGSLFSPSLAEWYRTHASVPVKTVRFPDSTHMLISEHPEEFAAELKKLL